MGGKPSAPGPLDYDPNRGPWMAVLYLLYDLAWVGAILLASPWWGTRSLLDRRFRAMVCERLTLPPPQLPEAGPRPRVLVHGVSVGEVKAAISIVRGLERDHEVIISASTNTGMKVARQTYPGLRVVRFPFDPSLVAGRFMRAVDPDLVVLMELEVWPNFLRRANRSGVPVAIVSGRITQASFANYKRLFSLTLPQFNRISLIAVQDARYAECFIELAGSADRVVVTGNVKIDGLGTGARVKDEELSRLAGGRPGQPVLVAGSTHEPEEVWVRDAFFEGAPGARVILVPRHPERAPAIVQALSELGRVPQRLTGLRQGQTPDPDRPLVVDTIGELEGIYALADLVFVGGSLVPHGGQNMLEPAAQGRPVLYGPHVDNFNQEALLLEEAGGARRVPDARALAQAVSELVGDRGARERMATAGMKAVEAQKGATARTLAELHARCLPRAQVQLPQGAAATGA
jgi:3-deoxy-D-manno-octulosonic-acid transferase